LGLADAMYKFFQCLRMMSGEPGILADLQRVFGSAGCASALICASTPAAAMALRVRGA
jgi:hypothetical protein